MKLLKISAAGVRGIVGEGMTAEIAIRFAQAFSSYLEGGVIAISRDSRPSRLLMRSAVVAGSLYCGSRVIEARTREALQKFQREFDELIRQP